ncbi:RNA recognition motif containing protein [Metarhizium acridum CQMa 102]|uniref:RNA recognition motif containing protein n=1 Tax=Metarhizium acridum (strain CQMa 102) TaxID=655827 RepID=E9EIQ7_METAQ|nr:RNA recognition motif containing protein [Metarhizium acridum CQMa 102]EFY84203.1 RNA recognition motif containing protein [Metarhizium acridum CQMa 102]
MGFGGGSWADEVEETYGTQPLPPSDRPRFGGGNSGMSNWQDRGQYLRILQSSAFIANRKPGYSSIRENLPQKLPDKPPFTAHLGNLAYDATNETVTEFFEGCEIVSVRIIEDREMQRPKGFGYVEFADIEGLKKALTLDGESFNGRMIKIKIADPPRGGDSRGGESSRDLSDWTRKGPLPDLPGRGGRTGSDFGGDRERRPPRDPAAEPRAPREMNWERRGPLSPLPPQEGGPGPREGSRSRPAPEGMGERGESHRGSRQGSASWGEGRQEGSRPPRREQPERVPTAAEKDFQWRSSMRPDAAKAQEETETAASPSAPAPAAQGGRPRLNLQKRTVTETTEAAPTTTSSGDSKASPFGAARPINTAAREQEIEEKRQIAIREKREADEKAKEERRLAKQAAAEKEEAEAAAAAAAAAAAQADEAKEPETKSAENEADEKQNGASTEQKGAPRSRESREPKEAFKSRATESGNWRSASNDQRVPRGPPGGGRGRGGAARGHRNEGRGGPRANGARDQQASAAQGAGEGETTPVDEDGWTTVPNKKGRQGRPLA